MNSSLGTLTPSTAMPLVSLYVGSLVPSLTSILYVASWELMEQGSGGKKTSSSLAAILTSATCSYNIAGYEEQNYTNITETKAYIESLSKEQLEQLSERLTLIDDSQAEIDKLNNQFDLIDVAESEGKIDEDILNEKRQEVMLDYIDTLSYNELTNLHDEILGDVFKTTEEELDEQLLDEQLRHTK